MADVYLVEIRTFKKQNQAAHGNTCLYMQLLVRLRQEDPLNSGVLDQAGQYIKMSEPS